MVKLLRAGAKHISTPTTVRSYLGIKLTTGMPEMFKRIIVPYGAGDQDVECRTQDEQVT